MKLRRLSIQRLPGIDRPFQLEDLGDGLNIIIGPNGIGKSRLCAAVRALLWRERGVKDGGLAASAVFEHQGTRWHVLRDGSRHGWQRDGIDEEPPALPGERLDGCFFLGLRDLLDDSDRAGRDLASEIRRQMSGGFDLDLVTQRFEESVPARVGSKERKDLNAAESKIQNAERRQITVAHQQDELDSLELSADNANQALQRLPHYKTAIAQRESGADLARHREDLARLPKALADLDGQEIGRLDKLEADLGQQRRDREAANKALSESRETASGTRLDQPIDPAFLDTWRQRAEDLAALERQLELARENAAAAQQAASECRQALGSPSAADSDDHAALTIDDDFDLFAFLRESHQLTTERVALQERLKLLAAGEFSDDDARRLELLKRAVEPLRAWLRAPDPAAHPSAATPRPSRSVYFWLAIAFAAIGVAAQFLLPSSVFAMLAFGIGIGLAAAGLLSRRPAQRADEGDATDWRAIAEKQFPETIDAPTRWSMAAVTERLRELEDESAQLDASKRGALYRTADRARLEQSMSSLDAPAGELETRRRELADRLGLDAPQPDVDMVDLARALDASRAAYAEARKAAAKRDELEGNWSQLLREIAVCIGDLGEDRPDDSAAARAGMRSLEARDRSLRTAIVDAKRAENSLETLAPEIENLEAERADLFRVARVEAGDRLGLTRLLGELSQYQSLKRSCEELASDVERAQTGLEAEGESALTLLDLPRLRAEQAALEEESQQLEELNREIGKITESARVAREGHVLEDAICEKNAVLNELRDRRDEALAAAAGVFLIDRVRREHETNQMPRVLERARKHFGTFTHHRYELNVSPSDGGSFVAVDTSSGVGLSPDKLSDGTRAQLILAARLAFAEEAEQGADLPLFLDEALDHSDPERFHAIARSLARMVADDGRQVFYLSNDPTDLERFRAAFDEEGCDELATIDLAEIRGHAARVEAPESLRVAPLAPVPNPAGESAESYGAAIGVPPLDPNRDPFSQHLYYLLRDDLGLLHELLLARIETAGQCRNLLQGGSAMAKEIVAGGEIGSQLEARIALLETFCLAWREGRGQNVSRLDIEQSGSVSGKYLDAVVAVAAEFDGDAGRLIAALRERKDPRLSGFRSKSADELERCFIEQGQIDDKPMLGESEIIERAIDTPAAFQLSPQTAAELLHLWWSLSEPR